MKTKVERDVRFLKLYSALITLVCAVFFLSGFVLQSKNQKFGEIDVERINIVEKDGKLKMVISNEARQHPGIVNGKIIKRNNSAMLLLSDIKGKPRIRLVVMPDGDAELEFMDETGKVTHSLPEQTKK